VFTIGPVGGIGIVGTADRWNKGEEGLGESVDQLKLRGIGPPLDAQAYTSEPAPPPTETIMLNYMALDWRQR